MEDALALRRQLPLARLDRLRLLLEVLLEFYRRLLDLGLIDDHLHLIGCFHSHIVLVLPPGQIPLLVLLWPGLHGGVWIG